MEQLPALITFDGDARSGKGTIVSLVKDYLRDERGRRVMFLIDAGQIFRVLVVVCREAGGTSIARIRSTHTSPRRRAKPKRLRASNKSTACQKPTAKRYYIRQRSASTVKIGARPEPDFKDGLLRKWLRDARAEGFDTVLLDGRALGEVGSPRGRGVVSLRT